MNANRDTVGKIVFDKRVVFKDQTGNITRVYEVGDTEKFFCKTDTSSVVAATDALNISAMPGSLLTMMAWLRAALVSVKPLHRVDTSTISYATCCLARPSIHDKGWMWSGT